MKLFHKIFLCFVVIFGLTFQISGYLLIHFAYQNAMEREKEYAFQEFQHNKYILQSILYMEPDLFEEDTEAAQAGEPDNNKVSRLTENFTTKAALYRMDGACLVSNMAAQPEIIDFEGEDNKITFQVCRQDGGSSILIAACVLQGETKIGLVTETDITSIVDTQRSMMTYFQRIYLIIMAIGFPVIFLLTQVLTGSIKKVSKVARRMAKGNYAERIPIDRQDEIGELAADFNQMAEQVEKRIAELSDAARQKEDFAANFAHELKTPLTSVIGYADMLYQRELPREQVKSAAEYILNEGMRLEALSLKLMDLFVLDKQDFLLEDTSVQDIFENLRQGVEPLCEKRGVSLHMEMEEGRIKTDYDLFKTMMLNLIDNAIKADCKDIWILGKRNKGRYQICIKDNGKGIPPEELSRITEAFYMVDKSRARKQHGAGLGLALVLKIAQIHKAGMRIASDGRSGTEVYVGF
ncbi:MAG: HAMP domain-containing histidine kinase [Bacteroidales bacterium]|nr:HAMP domain-containing histidine kinase [Lachnoclostridium sp.]MCM1384429.1 HAMP domain-containing histidine kinase [Lachnoclostridium sp.]MCM1465209.1 HAMP domain-containing histidine kinase [Bacteroidales bacterium]